MMMMATSVSGNRGFPLQAVTAQVNQTAAAQIIHQQHAAFLSEGDERRQGDFFRKADNFIIAGVNLENYTVSPRWLSHNPSGVSGSRRPLAEPGSAFFHHLGDAGFSTDFNQFSRETIASFLSASVLSTSSTAAALLLTTRASSAPVSVHRMPLHMVITQPAPALLQIKFQVGYLRPTSTIAATGPAQSGDRPRLVCRMIPAALMHAAQMRLMQQFDLFTHPALYLFARRNARTDPDQPPKKNTLAQVAYDGAADPPCDDFFCRPFKRSGFSESA